MKKKILQDHKKIGKKLIPPLKSSAIPLREGDYTQEILPEIIWIVLIHEEIGQKKGIELVYKFVSLVNDSRETKEYFNFAISSNLYRLTNSEKEKLIKKLIDSGFYLEISNMLSPLIYFYKNSPFSFLSKEIDLTKYEEELLLNKLKRCIGNCFDRFQKSSVIAMANVFYVKALDGKIHYPSHINPPDLNILIENPDSEEANSVSAQIRNHMKTEFMMLEHMSNYNADWAKSFWNQSYKLDTCDFRGENDD